MTVGAMDEGTVGADAGGAVALDLGGDAEPAGGGDHVGRDETNEEGEGRGPEAERGGRGGDGGAERDDVDGGCGPGMPPRPAVPDGSWPRLAGRAADRPSPGHDPSTNDGSPGPPDDVDPSGPSAGPPPTRRDAGGTEGEPHVLQDVLQRKRDDRAKAIDRLEQRGRERGNIADRTFWAMVYDFEHAPTTTNRRQLAEIGIDVPAPESLADDELSIQLWVIIRGLASLHIYLSSTRHLTDRQLYERLAREVLDEEVRDIVAADNVHEWIDLASMESSEVFETYYESWGPDAAPPASDRDDFLPKPES